MIKEIEEIEQVPFTRTKAINKILDLTKRVRAIKGGTSAGKTYGVIPILIDKAAKTPNYRISVVSKTMPHLKRGAIRDFKKIMKDTLRWNEDHWHDTDKIYTFSNGAFIEFFSVDDELKVRGPRRDMLYCNEANKLDFESYRQLAKRTEDRIYLDWNPTGLFWFDKEIKNDKNVDFITLTYLDNEAAPQSSIDDILESKEKGFFNPNLEPPELFKEENIKNAYWANDYRVYGLGLTGKLQGTVFPEWRKGIFDTSLPHCFGIDFGFSPDACGIPKVAVDTKNKLIYVEEKAYKHELGTSDIIKIMHRVNPDNKIIIADNQQKITIHDMRRKGINVVGGKKGPGSVEAGIKAMQDYTIVVCGESPNLEMELDNYVWNDKKSGIPKKGNDHLIDPIRYAFTYLTRG